MTGARLCSPVFERNFEAIRDGLAPYLRAAPGPVLEIGSGPGQHIAHLALAYPDRIGRRRSGPTPRYQLSNGKGATLREDDALGRNDWLVAADLDGQSREATIFLAAPVQLADLEQDLADHIQELEEATWDDKRGTVVARRVRRLGQLVLAEQALPQPEPQQPAYRRYCPSQMTHRQ